MTITIPEISIQEMLDSGVHYGHKKAFWNPKMEPFIYTSKNGLHIINLQKTAVLFRHALQHVAKLIASKPNAKILFVATKRQASDSIKEAAQKCDQYFVNHRWLGGMLTNWKTISGSITKMESFEKTLKAAADGEEQKYNKKELLNFDRKRQKLDSSIGGIRSIAGKPDIIFVIDTNKENIAIKEARCLGIPIIAIVDTNSNPDDIDFPIPGNDDAVKAIAYYCSKLSETILNARANAPVTSSDMNQKSIRPPMRRFSKVDKVVSEAENPSDVSDIVNIPEVVVEEDVVIKHPSDVSDIVNIPEVVVEEDADASEVSDTVSVPEVVVEEAEETKHKKSTPKTKTKK